MKEWTNLRKSIVHINIWHFFRRVVSNCTLENLIYHWYAVNNAKNYCGRNVKNLIFGEFNLKSKINLVFKHHFDFFSFIVCLKSNNFRNCFVPYFSCYAVFPGCKLQTRLTFLTSLSSQYDLFKWCVQLSLRYLHIRYNQYILENNLLLRCCLIWTNLTDTGNLIFIKSSGIKTLK